MTHYRSLIGGFYSARPFDKSYPTSIRTNNPGAINGAAWERRFPGYVDTVETTPGNKTTIFETPEQGVAAWWQLLKNYRSSGAVTVGQIITRYGGGQNYSAYVDFVVKDSGLSAHQEIRLEEDMTLLRLAHAMFRYEAGCRPPWSDAQVLYGIELAREYAHAARRRDTGVIIGDYRMFGYSFGFWMSLLTAVIGGLIAAGTQLTDLLGPDRARQLLAWLALANVIVNVINVKIASPQAGPLATKFVPAQAMMKLGKLPARLNAFKLRFSNYFDTNKLPTPPATFGHSDLVKDFGVLGNNKYGDCVFAGAAHEEMIWHAEGGRAIDVFTDQSVLASYGEQAGFDPADPRTDTGTDMASAAEWRRKVGLLDKDGNRHKVDAYVGIHARGLDHVLTATYLFGAIGTGVVMPHSALKQFEGGEPWHIVENDSIDGGHYVPIVGRRNNRLVIVTWGKEHEVEDEWWMRYNDENVVYLSQDVLDKLKQTSPEGFDYATLIKDIRSLQREGQRP